MRVLIVHNGYQQFGGEDSVVKAEQQLLENHGDEVRLFTRHNDEIKNFGLLDKVAFVPRTLYSGQTARKLTQTVREFKPDIAFAHNVYPLLSPSAFYRLHSLGVPTVQVMHNFRPFCPNGLYYTQGKICEKCRDGNYLNAIRYRCYKDSLFFSGLYGLTLGLNRLAGMMNKISGFICLTEFFKIKLGEAGVPAEKLFVRPNFLYAPPLPDEPTTAVGYVLYLGRLSAEKGCWTMVKAFEQVPQVSLKIIGTGPLEEEIRAYIRDRNIPNIEMLGFKAGEEKWNLLRNALCTIVPSEWYENFPVVVLEAYSAAKPVLASRIGGLPFIVEDGRSGLLFEPGSVPDLVRVIQQMAGNPDLAAALGARCRQLAETTYGPDEAYRNLMGIFQRVQRT